MDVDVSFLGLEARRELERVFQHIVDGIRRGAVDDFSDARAGVRHVMKLHQQALDQPPAAADPGI